MMRLTHSEQKHRTQEASSLTCREPAPPGRGYLYLVWSNACLSSNSLCTDSALQVNTTVDLAAADEERTQIATFRDRSHKLPSSVGRRHDVPRAIGCPSWNVT